MSEATHILKYMDKNTKICSECIYSYDVLFEKQRVDRDAISNENGFNATTQKYIE